MIQLSKSMTPMLRFSYFFALFLSLSITTLAQPYIGMTDSMNQWNFRKNSSGPCPGCCQDYTYYFDGDTTIGFYTYKSYIKVR